MPEFVVVEADPSDTAQAETIVDLLDAYARGPMGSGAPLPDDVRARLPAGLAAHPMSRVWLAHAGDAAIGVVVVFEGYSTFAAAPVFNIHDLAVLESHQGRGVGRALLGAVEAAARQRGGAKLTLEVLERNTRAVGLYRSLGFEGGRDEAETSTTFFFSKRLSPEP